MTNRLAAVCLAAISLVVAPITWAQSDELVTITIDESQPLSDALQSFADQTDLQVIFFADITEGKDAPVLEGEFTADAALDTLLADTGLSYTFIDDTAVSVQATVTPERGASDSKNSIPQPVLMAQNQMSPTPTTSSRSSEGGTSIVTGKVTDARTGANLKGAKVTIEETGQWTSTNDLGEFRFVNVPTGSATLIVSYLGYAGQSAAVSVRGDSVSQSFVLRGGSEIDEIVVFGQRSARAQALNMERTADNVSTVVSTDFLGAFPGSTISDALRRVPGVAFQSDNVTGDGTNIIVRGIEPDLNAVKFNGIELPIGEVGGRSASLANILTESVGSVTISKTLLPSQDTAGTGGLVEIETLGPLDRPARFLSAAAIYGEGSGFDDAEYSLTASGRFGANEQFGVSVSAQYRDRGNDTATFGGGLVFGEYLPLSPAGTPTIASTSFIDPTRTFPFESGANRAFYNSATYTSATADTENFALNVSAAYRLADHTTVELTYQLAEADRSRDSATATFVAPVVYSLQPVQQLAGEERFAAGPNGFYGVTQNYRFSDSSEETEIISLRGDTSVGKWTFDYLLGFTEGRGKTPLSVTMATPSLNSRTPGFEDLISDQAIDPEEGRPISYILTERGVPTPALTQAGFVAFADPNSLQFGSLLSSPSQAVTERTAAELSVKRVFNTPIVEYVSVGVDFEDSENSGFSPFSQTFSPSSDLSFADLGYSPTAALIFDARADANLFGLSQSDFRSLFADAQRLAAAGTGEFAESIVRLDDFAPQVRQTALNEEELALFLETKLVFDKFEFVGGFRWSRFDITSTTLDSVSLIDETFAFDLEFQAENSGIVDLTATQEEVLPRFSINYRHSDNLIARLAYFKSLARPDISQLSRARSVQYYLGPFFGPNFNQPAIFFSEGNPDLKPADTDNYDLSIEWYDDNAGVIKLGFFYKKINNPLRTETEQLEELPAGFAINDDPRIQAVASDFTLFASTPVNSPFSGSILGVELAIEKQFLDLPGVWSGLGAFGNLTYTEGSIDEEVNWSNSPTFDPATGAVVSTDQVTLVAKNSPLSQQPEWSGTAGLTYNSYSWDANLAYSYQDKRRTFGFSPFYLTNNFNERDTLDLSVSYRIMDANQEYFLFFEGQDLLSDKDDTQFGIVRGGENGVPEYVQSGTFRGGRSFSAGIRATFY